MKTPNAHLGNFYLEGSKGHSRKGYRENPPWKHPKNTQKTPWNSWLSVLFSLCPLWYALCTFPVSPPPSRDNTGKEKAKLSQRAMNGCANETRSVSGSVLLASTHKRSTEKAKRWSDESFTRILGPATTQNLVVKFDGEICGGILVENASDDFPQQRKLENLLPNFAGSSPPISPKLRQLHSGNRWCLELIAFIASSLQTPSRQHPLWDTPTFPVNLFLTNEWGFLVFPLFFPAIAVSSEHICERVQKHCDRWEKRGKTKKS